MSRRSKNFPADIAGDTPEPVRHAEFNENAPLTEMEEHALALLITALEVRLPHSSVSRLRTRRFDLPDDQGGSAPGDLVQTSIDHDRGRVRCVFAMLDGRVLEYTLQLSSEEFDFIQAKPGRYSTATH